MAGYSERYVNNKPAEEIQRNSGPLSISSEDIRTNVTESDVRLARYITCPDGRTVSITAMKTMVTDALEESLVTEAEIKVTLLSLSRRTQDLRNVLEEFQCCSSEPTDHQLQQAVTHNISTFESEVERTFPELWQSYRLAELTKEGFRSIQRDIRRRQVSLRKLKQLVFWKYHYPNQEPFRRTGTESNSTFSLPIASTVTNRGMSTTVTSAVASSATANRSSKDNSVSQQPSKPVTLIAKKTTVTLKDFKSATPLPSTYPVATTSSNISQSSTITSINSVPIVTIQIVNADRTTVPQTSNPQLQRSIAVTNPYRSNEGSFGNPPLQRSVTVAHPYRPNDDSLIGEID